MHDVFLRALNQRRAQISDRWEALLRVEPVTTPLGHPDTLVFGIRDALKEILTQVRQPSPEPPPPPVQCVCGRNPLHAFYRAGEQALLEALVLEQVRHQALTPAQRDSSFAELRSAIDHVKNREIGALASLCQHQAGADAAVRTEPARPATGDGTISPPAG